MRTEDQVWSMLVDANPIPDSALYARRSKVARSPLGNHEKRSEMMTERDMSPDNGRKRGGSWVTLAAAGLAVVLVGAIAWAISKQPASDAVAVAETEPSTSTVVTQPAVSSTSISPTSTTLPTLTSDDWEAIPFGMGGAAGEYRTNGFGVDFRFTVPAGWLRIEQEDEFLMPLAPGSGCETQPCDALIFVTTSQSVEDVVSQLSSLEGVGVEPEGAVSVGGADGMALTVSVDPEASAVSLYRFEHLPEAPGITGFPGSASRLYAVDVDGRTVLIVVQTKSGQVSFFEEAQRVVDSIVWKDRANRPGWLELNSHRVAEE